MTGLMICRDWHTLVWVVLGTLVLGALGTLVSVAPGTLVGVACRSLE